MSAKKEGGMWSFTDPFWEAVFRISTICALLFGGTGILSAFVSAWVGYEITDAVQKEADRKLKEADRRIAEANARSDEAHAEAERASERAAGLEKDAAQARLKTEVLRQKMAWRRLTKEQHDIIVDTLQGHDIEVWTSFVGTDPESVTYRSDIDEALKEAGVKTKHFSGWKMSVGVSLTNIPNPDLGLLIEAFSKAGIPFNLVDPERGLQGLEIRVGSKPPPF